MSDDMRGDSFRDEEHCDVCGGPHVPRSDGQPGHGRGLAPVARPEGHQPRTVLEGDRLKAWSGEQASEFFRNDFPMLGATPLMVELLRCRIATAYLLGANAALLDETSRALRRAVEHGL